MRVLDQKPVATALGLYAARDFNSEGDKRPTTYSLCPPDWQRAKGRAGGRALPSALLHAGVPGGTSPLPAGNKLVRGVNGLGRTAEGKLRA